MTFGAQSAQSSGWTVSVKPYSAGDAGIRQSLQEVARLMRLAKDDPRIKRWAVESLAARGVDGRNKPSVRQQAAALLEAFRAQTIYVPDSAGAEHVQAARITLCLGDQCIPGEDCESLCLALGGVMLSIGLPVYAVKVDYGPEHQQHLVLGLIDELGNKFYADPSTNKPLLDEIPGAVDLEWVDPLDQAGTLGVVGAEIVTLGAVATMLTKRSVSRETSRALFLVGKTWHEHRHGKWWTHTAGRWSARPSGIGAPFARDGRWWVAIDGTEAELTDSQATGMGLPAATTVPTPTVTNQTPYQPVTNSQVKAGLRYRLGVQITSAIDPADPTTLIAGLFSADWYVESIELQPGGGFVPGLNVYERPFIIQGIANRDMTLTNTDVINYLVVGVQSSTSNVPALPAAPVAVSSGNTNVSFATATVVAAVVGGVGYGLWRNRKRLARHG